MERRNDDLGPKVFKRLNTIHLLLLAAGCGLVLRNSRVSERTFRLWIEYMALTI